jgi:precorrin-2 C20-methyltransferase/precorrin-3B C17-methyltransferase
MSGAGRLTVVGLGPGGDGFTSPDARTALAAATDLVGYGPYLDQVPADVGGRRHPSDNREEADRARFALDLAAAGGVVAVVSSGDPGVFAMASAVWEQLDEPAERDRWADVEVDVTPGITAAQAAAARVGAPLGHDFCVISLSDNLKPWELVERRLAAAASADFVLALYNPRSRARPWQFARAMEIVGEHRDPTTPVVVATDVTRPGETITVVALADATGVDVGMRTVVLVGSSTTRWFDRDGRTVVYTPRRAASG